MSKPPNPHGGQAGYNLVILVVAITVMNILIAAMLPLWSQAIRREKEEELVFRGFQYAEAIRLYRARHQTFPTKLEQLIEVKPRVIRQLWKDPMTEDGKWGLIFENDPRGTPLNPRTPGPDPNNPDGGDSGDGGDTADGRPQLSRPRKGETVQVGPIIGVYSKSPKKSILVMFGRERYDEWRFTHDLVTPTRQRFQGTSSANPNPTALSNMSTRWTGRPMRFVNQIPGGTLPGGEGPGGGPGAGGPGGGGPRGPRRPGNPPPPPPPPQ